MGYKTVHMMWGGDEGGARRTAAERSDVLAPAPQAIPRWRRAPSPLWHRAHRRPWQARQPPRLGCSGGDPSGKRVARNGRQQRAGGGHAVRRHHLLLLLELLLLLLLELLVPRAEAQQAQHKASQLPVQ